MVLRRLPHACIRYLWCNGSSFVDFKALHINACPETWLCAELRMLP